LHRVLLFEGQWYAVYSYGFMLVMGMLAGLWLSLRRASTYGLTRDQVLDFALAVLVGGIIGARVVAVYEEWPSYSGDLAELINIRQGGLSWLGGVLGGFIAFLIYVGRSQIPRGVLLDMATPGLVLGHVLGRLGCFLNGCCHGCATSVGWAVTFPDAPELGFVARHPTQVYEAVGEFLVLLVLLALQRVFPLGRGAIFYAYVSIYAVERFFIEYLRMEPILAGGLTLAQYASFAILAGGLIGLYRALAVPQPALVRGEA